MPVTQALSPSPAPARVVLDQGAGLAGRTGLAYGLLGLPLAFVSLPLYVSLPHHYATQAGVPLASLGAVLLLTRLLDAGVDPWLGRWVDRAFQRGEGFAWGLAAAGALVLGLAFAAVWHPPASGGPATLLWLGASLLLCMGGYSLVSIVHQAWGTRWGGNPGQRATVVAWREAAALVGVLLASVLGGLGWVPALIAGLALGLAVGLLGLAWVARRLPLPSHAAATPVHGAEAQGRSPWQQADFRALLAVFMLNGVATAVPATLLPFYVADQLQVSDALPLFLLVYFGAGALGLPVWVRLVRHWGLARTWRWGMVAAVLAFSPTPWLGPGDTLGFTLVCLASGLALGADLALPGALLTGVIQRAGGSSQAEGRYLGWWACATKLNLALAAGLCLPLLALAGYQAGAAVGSPGLVALAWAYGGLPAALKLLAAAGLAWAERQHPTWAARH